MSPGRGDVTGPRIPHSGDQPPPFCGTGHPGEVPYVEALAFWGRTVDRRIVPRSYALAVLADHPYLEHGWQEPPARFDKLCAAAADLADWENIVVDMATGPGDFFDYLQCESDLLTELQTLPTKIAFCDTGRRDHGASNRGP
jgi:hypothetical protein